METRANYALIGVFTLLVVAAAVGFVWWSAGADKVGGLKTYKVVFTGSIAGLATGNAVLFNGVRVGEVAKIDYMPDDASKVYAIISIDGRVPVRADTKAQLEYTGLTGSAAVGLSGESNSAPVLATSTQNPAVLQADKSDFQDLLQTAQKIAARASDMVDRGDKLIAEASPPLQASVVNLQHFTDALASNSDGLKDFMASMADVGRTIKPLTAKLETLSTDTDNVVKAVDPKQVRQMLADYAGTAAKLNAAAAKVDSVLTNLNGFLSTSDSKGVFQEVSDAAKSFKRLSEDTDSRTRELFANMTRFSRDGLKQYEALAADGRGTVAELTRLVKSIEANPQQFLFGKN